MAKDPRYVRLTERLVSGNVTDLETGWSCAGLDVKEFPKDDPEEASFVREHLRLNNLEEASSAEFNVLQEHAAKVEAVAPDPKSELGHQSPWNESAIRKAAKKGYNVLLNHRLQNVTDETASEEEPEKVSGKK